MHTLFLIQVDDSRPAAIMRGIKAALTALDHPAEQIIEATTDVCQRALKGELPIGLAEVEDVARVQAAAQTLEVESRGAATGAVDLPEDQLRELATNAARANAQADEPEASDDAFVQHLEADDGVSRDAALTALALLASNNGQVPATFNLARMLARTTSDTDLYVEVCQIICTTFDIRVSA